MLSDENRIGLILYAAKCANESGGDEGKKFGYLRHISDLWNERGWNTEDKRVILEAVSYLINLTDKGYEERIVEHVRNLKMAKEDQKMFETVFERVSKREGMEMGRQEKALEIAKNLLIRGVAPDIIAESSGLSIDEVKTLSMN